MAEAAKRLKVIKKGVAKKQPQAKKRKIQKDTSEPAKSNKTSSESTRQRRLSNSGVNPDKEHVQESEASDSDDVEDPNEVYCICRKPDNHTWMIGCDGGCDDWFHGACVGRKPEEKDLIDRFVCPNCTEKGAGITTWKPMCRLPGCNHPARLKKGEESKYCSEECGIEFFARYRESAKGSEQENVDTRSKSKAKSKNSLLSSARNPDEDEQGDPLGGSVLVAHVKSLLDACNDINEFRHLGDSEATTPPASPPGSLKNPEGDLNQSLQFTDHEAARLQELATLKSKLRDTRMQLKQREELIRLVRERANRLKERESSKSVCGHDSRLAWSDAECAKWLDTGGGKSVMDNGTLSPPPRTDSNTPIGHSPSFEICKRKNCSRHGNWQKLALQDLRHDAQLLREEMEGVLHEEREKLRTAKARKGIPMVAEGTVDLAGT